MGDRFTSPIWDSIVTSPWLSRYEIENNGGAFAVSAQVRRGARRTAAAGKGALALGPVSRILLPRLAPGTGCHFSPAGAPCGARAGRGRLPRRSAGRPDAAYPRLSDGPPSLLFCLAPEGVFRAARLAAARGGLLPHLFTLTRLRSLRSVGRRYVLCDTLRRRGLTRDACTCPMARAASCPAVSGLSSPSCCGIGF